MVLIFVPLTSVSCLLPICVAIVVAKLGSPPSASDSSFNVSNVLGAEFTNSATLVSISEDNANVPDLLGILIRKLFLVPDNSASSYSNVHTFVLVTLLALGPPNSCLNSIFLGLILVV